MLQQQRTFFSKRSTRATLLLVFFGAVTAASGGATTTSAAVTNWRDPTRRHEIWSPRRRLPHHRAAFRRRIRQHRADQRKLLYWLKGGGDGDGGSKPDGNRKPNLGDILTRVLGRKAHFQNDQIDDDDNNSEFVVDTKTTSDERMPVPLAGLFGVSSSSAATATGIFSVGKVLVSGIQLGLLCYLGHAIWKAVSDVMEELSRDMMAGTSTDGGPLCRPHDLTKLLTFLAQDATTIRQSATTMASGKRVANLPPLPLLQVAHKLLSAGLPLRAPLPAAPTLDNDETASSSLSASSTLPSVESVLASLSRSEASLLQQCLWAPSMHSDAVWNSVVGLDLIKERLWRIIDTVRTPGNTNAFAPLFDEGNTAGGATHTAPGVLLYGPPGCGKTLLVKSVATRAELPCLVVSPSVLLRKYVGDTNLQVRHLFSLAHKLAPCLLCIDELDGLFRERSDTEHEVSRDLKTEFLQFMDGLLGDNDAINESTTTSNEARKVLVIGATNRPFDVDSAILRRLPNSLFVGLPHAQGRAALLRTLLARVPVEPQLDIASIVAQTEGYSPSDLKQLLQTASTLGPLAAAKGNNKNEQVLTLPHIVSALASTPPTPLTDHYRVALAKFCRAAAAGAHPLSSLSNHEGKDRYWCDVHARWESSLWGNFYDVGSVELDPNTFDQVTDMLKDWKAEYDENMEDLDNDNDDRRPDDE